jgi:GNAT superfamily N-acetyltransferase
MANGDIRPAQPGDVAEILQLIRDLADYEKLLHEVETTEADLHDMLFSDNPAAFAHVVEHESQDQRLAGFALWFRNASTWTGRYGLYLEDLYVRPEHRGSGYGRGLLATLAAICVERGYARFEWSVLDWNTPSIEFYRALGAVPMDGWTGQRVTGDALAALADQAPARS